MMGGMPCLLRPQEGGPCCVETVTLHQTCLELLMGSRAVKVQKRELCSRGSGNREVNRDKGELLFLR